MCSIADGLSARRSRGSKGAHDSSAMWTTVRHDGAGKETDMVN
jgi:hypothetical protein